MQSTLLLAVILTKISYAFVASLLCFFSSFLSDIVQSYGSDKNVTVKRPFKSGIKMLFTICMFYCGT